MPKQMWRALNNLSPSDVKLMNLPRTPAGLYNMHFDEYGNVIKRAGYSTYNENLGASHKIIGMHRMYQQDLSKEFLVAWNTKIYKEVWISPTGFNDPDTAWTWEEKSYDDDITSFAYVSVGIPANTWSKYIELTHSALDCDKIRFYAHYDIADITKVDVDIYYSSAWHDVYEGLYIDNVWTEKELGGSYSVTKMRFRFYSIVDDVVGALYEASFHQSVYTSLESDTSTDLVLTADKDTFFADFDDVCYIVNGTDGVFKYDKTYARTVGITVGGACSGTGAGSSGYLGAGDYKYRYTYVDEDGYESNGSTASAAITASALNTISLTSVANSSDPKVASKNIYRTSVNGAIYYYEGAIADNTTTTFSSTIADTSLGTALHTNHTAPPSTSHLITKRRNKLYLAYLDYLYPSHTSDVEYFPATWRIRTGNSQKIMGLLEQLTALPVTTVDSIERLVGTDEDNFEFKNSYSTEGNVAIRSYVNCDNMLVYLGYNGINYFDGVSSGIFSEAVNKYIRDNIVDAYRHLSCATYFNDKYILCYPKTGGTYPTETIWVDLKNKTYGLYSFAFSCFSLWDKGTDGLKLKGGSNTIGQVYSLFDGLDDNTAAIEAYDQIDYLDFGIPEREKNYYKIYVRCEVTTESTLTVYYQTDIDTEASVTATLTAGKDQWYELNLPGDVRGRAIKIRPRVSNKYTVTFKGYMIQYSVEELRV